jgi:hypothetical protein
MGCAKYEICSMVGDFFKRNVSCDMFLITDGTRCLANQTIVACINEWSAINKNSDNEIGLGKSFTHNLEQIWVVLR